jgi:hypothetical protein
MTTPATAGLRICFVDRNDAPETARVDMVMITARAGSVAQLVQRAAPPQTRPSTMPRSIMVFLFFKMARKEVLMSLIRNKYATAGQHRQGKRRAKSGGGFGAG